MPQQLNRHAIPRLPRLDIAYRCSRDEKSLIIEVTVDGACSQDADPKS
jgi:hypothetical protein